jgi:uncharacterized protein YecT (DUF1311 family)
MVQMKKLLLILVSLSCGVLFSVDNPEAPDLVGAFETRVQPFEKQSDQVSGGAAASTAFGKYEKFLDAELNKVHRALLHSLPKPDQEKLKKSQRQWILFRDSEFDFMGARWNAETSGSSWTLQSGQGRTGFIKKRVIELLRYCEQAASCKP